MPSATLVWTRLSLQPLERRPRGEVETAREHRLEGSKRAGFKSGLFEQDLWSSCICVTGHAPSASACQGLANVSSWAQAASLGAGAKLVGWFGHRGARACVPEPSSKRRAHGGSADGSSADLAAVDCSTAVDGSSRIAGCACSTSSRGGRPQPGPTKYGPEGGKARSVWSREAVGGERQGRGGRLEPSKWYRSCSWGRAATGARGTASPFHSTSS